jgi:hypothetical protein
MTTTHHETLDPHANATDTPSTPQVLFRPGRVVATPGALAALDINACPPLDLLKRHLTGDWGEVPPEDADANRQALIDGSRLLSSYTLANGTRIWLITEADRSVTTLLRPEEY